MKALTYQRNPIHVLTEVLMEITGFCKLIDETIP